MTHHDLSWQMACSHLQKGNISLAKETCEQVLTENPQHANTLNLMGIISCKTNEFEKAIEYIQKAMDKNPERAPVYAYNLATTYIAKNDLSAAIVTYLKAGQTFNERNEASEATSCFNKAAILYTEIGLKHHREDDFDEAIDHYNKAIAIKADCIAAYHNLGIALKAQGRLDEVVDTYHKLITIDPENYEAYNNLGTAYQAMDRLTEAYDCYKKALEIKPDFSNAHNNLGVIYDLRENYEQARECFVQAINNNPDNIEFINNLGNTYRKLGRIDDSIKAYCRVLEERPNYAEVIHNLGLAYQDANQLDNAIFHYIKALEINSDLAPAHFNLAEIYQSLNLINDAIVHYNKAIDIDPFFIQAHSNIAFLYQQKFDFDKCIHHSRLLLDLKPDYEPALTTLYIALRATCNWKECEELSNKIDLANQEALDNQRECREIPFVNLFRTSDLKNNYEVAKNNSFYVEKSINRIHQPYTHPKVNLNREKLTIGYLSNDFHNHATSHLMLGLFGLHDRDKFTINVYSYGPNDGSYYRNKIERDCDHFVDIELDSIPSAAKKIFDDQVDILVDLKGYTAGCRPGISVLRPAPVIATYLGYPGTSGATFFDYIITDKIVSPMEHAPYYSEALVYMPHCYQINDNKQIIKEGALKRSDFNLPEDGFVFASFNQAYKFDPLLFDIWMNLLIKVPNSVLWLYPVHLLAEKNLKKVAQSKGVDPSRIVFGKSLAKDEHLARLQLADLALDTRLFNGHTTTSDALWAGLPVIALQGNHFASRVSSSILQAANMNELITYSLEEYFDKAVDLACNPKKLKNYRDKLAQHRLTCPLFDTERFTHDLEKGYQIMWQRYQEGFAPDHIDIANEIK